MDSCFSTGGATNRSLDPSAFPDRRDTTADATDYKRYRAQSTSAYSLFRRVPPHFPA